MSIARPHRRASSTQRTVRRVAGILTIAFAIVSVPFLFLTTSHIVAGNPVATGTLIVYVVYTLVLVVVTAYWFRKVRGPARG